MYFSLAAMITQRDEQFRYKQSRTIMKSSYSISGH